VLLIPKINACIRSWSAANIIVAALPQTPQTRRCAISPDECNVGQYQPRFAGLGYWEPEKEKIDNPTLAAVLKHQNRIERPISSNVGLDVVYGAPVC